MGSAKSTTPREATERDQFWLDHEAAQAESGQNAKEYAAEHGISVDAFYQARKRLRALGLLARPANGKAASPKRPSSKPMIFSKIAVPASPEARFRLELPGGVAFEWSGDELPASAVALLERWMPRA